MEASVNTNDYCPYNRQPWGHDWTAIPMKIGDKRESRIDRLRRERRDQFMLVIALLLVGAVIGTVRYVPGLEQLGVLGAVGALGGTIGGVLCFLRRFKARLTSWQRI